MRFIKLHPIEIFSVITAIAAIESAEVQMKLVDWNPCEIFEDKSSLGSLNYTPFVVEV